MSVNHLNNGVYQRNHVGFGFPTVTVLALTLFTETALAFARYVSGLVPDWNQPYRYIAASPNGGPGPDPMPFVANQWNAWCAPCSAANLAGHWEDVRGVAVADTVAFPGSTVAWAVGASWQDYLADGFARPGPQVVPGSLPALLTDLGWYMDTNRGIPYDPPGVGTMGGLFFIGNGAHTGTYLKDIHAGLQTYLTTCYGLPAGVVWYTGTEGRAFAIGNDPGGGPAVQHLVEATAFAEVMSEINTNRTLLISYASWTLTQTGFFLPQSGTNSEAALGGAYFIWNTSQPPSTNAEDEVWNSGDNGESLGHVVTAVGYIPAGDPDDKGPTIFGPGTFVNWVIVHDNWSSTPRNVIIPFYKNAPWVANTTAVPFPTATRFVKGLVPDWNQPYQYNAQSQNGGPGPDPAVGIVNQWNAWCVPCSAANLAGHWTDYHLAPVADTTPYTGSTVAWAMGPSWQDYLADGFARPLPQPPNPMPVPTTDIGWYLDTNRMIPYDAGLGMMGGFNFGNPGHAGTYLKDIDIGVLLYLNSQYFVGGAGWSTGTQGKGFFSGMNPTGGPARILINNAEAFGEVVSEINRNRTLILSYRHWNVAAQPVAPIPATGTNTEAQLGATYYGFNSSPGSSNAEDEPWTMDDTGLDLGHAVTAVGYIPAGDLLDPGPMLKMGPTDWVIVHDNWVSTPRNVVIPFDFALNWVANTSAGPDPSLLKITGITVTNGTNVVIRFIGLPGATHELLYNNQLTNTWSVAISNVKFAPYTMQVTDRISNTNTQRFYKVRAN